MTPCPAIPKPPMERTRYGHKPAHPPSNRQRIDRYEEARVTVDETEEQLIRRMAEGLVWRDRIMQRGLRVPRHRALVPVQN